MESPGSPWHKTNSSMVIRLSFNGIEEKHYHNLCRRPKKASVGSLQNRLTAYIRNFLNDITTLFHRIIYALKHCKAENNDSLAKHLIMHLKNNSISIKNQDVVDRLFKELAPRVQNRLKKRILGGTGAIKPC